MNPYLNFSTAESSRRKNNLIKFGLKMVEDP